MDIAHYVSDDLQAMEQRYRAAFINSLGGFKSVALVGTQNGAGKTNLAIFSSLFHIGANPPLCGLIFRPDTGHRHTLDNILETGQYTINHVLEEFYVQAHQTSARYERGISEFDETGLTPEYHSLPNAPYVLQSRLKFGLQFTERVDLKINGTIMLIGRIVEVIVPGQCVAADGAVDLEMAGTLTLSGLDSYHATRKLARLTYAKPGQWPDKLITPGASESR